jgi:hypothetical protein
MTHPLFDELRVQLELGVPQEIVDLARLAGSRLVRADYLRLLRAGLTNEPALSACSDERLASILQDLGKASILRASLAKS